MLDRVSQRTIRWLRPVRFWGAALIVTALAAPALVLAQDDPAMPEAVVDAAPPAVFVPGDVVVAAADGAGAVAWFEVSAADDVDGPVGAICAPGSGSWFPLGATWVACTAADAAGNLGFAGFNVIVFDGAGPVIEYPGDVWVSTSDPAGAAVAFAVPAAYDAVDGSVPVSCDAQPGAFFPVGTTVVTCWAQDWSGNPAAAVGFAVTVEHYAPPPDPTPEPTEAPADQPVDEPAEEPTQDPGDAGGAPDDRGDAPDGEEPAGEEPADEPTDETPAEIETPVPGDNPAGEPTNAPGTDAPPADEPTAAPPIVEVPDPVISEAGSDLGQPSVDEPGPHRVSPVDDVATPVAVPDALELPYPLPPAIRITGSGPIDGLALIWGYLEFPLSQEFGHTDFSISHASWYSYGADYGLDGMMHTGLDVAMPAGTPLYSPVDGTVVVAGGVPFFTFYGNGQPGVGELLIETDDGHQVILGHMGRIAVEAGQRVQMGEFVGLSGGDNGDHLHLEVRERTETDWYRIVDPRQSFLAETVEDGIIGDVAVDDGGADEAPAAEPVTPDEATREVSE